MKNQNIQSNLILFFPLDFKKVQVFIQNSCFKLNPNPNILARNTSLFYKSNT